MSSSEWTSETYIFGPPGTLQTPRRMRPHLESSAHVCVRRPCVPVLGHGLIGEQYVDYRTFLTHEHGDLEHLAQFLESVPEPLAHRCEPFRIGRAVLRTFRVARPAAMDAGLPLKVPPYIANSPRAAASGVKG